MTTERPTPETDRLQSQYISGEMKWCETFDSFRTIERQRDELSDWLEAEHLLNDRIRKELEVVKAQRDGALAEDHRNNQIMIRIMAQRDELMKALDAVSDKGAKP